MLLTPKPEIPMCQGKTDERAQNLHERICATTHGYPCKAVHAIGSFFSLILGREPRQDCCSGPDQKSTCDCKTTPP